MQIIRSEVDQVEVQLVLLCGNLYTQEQEQNTLE